MTTNVHCILFCYAIWCVYLCVYKLAFGWGQIHRFYTHFPNRWLFGFGYVLLVNLHVNIGTFCPIHFHFRWSLLLHVRFTLLTSVLSHFPPIPQRIQQSLWCWQRMLLLSKTRDEKEAAQFHLMSWITQHTRTVPTFSTPSYSFQLIISMCIY